MHLTRPEWWPGAGRGRLVAPLAALLAGALLLLPAARATPAQAQDADQSRGISVVGAGRVVVAPDIARVVLGVDQFDPSLALALSSASSSMNAVVDRLVQLGVSRDDIQTVRFSVQPVYDTRNDAQVLRGYRVSNAVSATIRSVDQVGMIIDQAVAAGASRVEGITFDTSRLSELKDQARAEAMANARAKAEQLAGLAGVSLGRVSHIQESDVTPPSPVRAAAPAAAAAPSTPIESGQLEVRTTVSVTWEIS